ncbi:MAG: PilW family protein [Methylococcales bacterium]|nr:PilW family protein [Methylococcales bacterium]
MNMTAQDSKAIPDAMVGQPPVIWIKQQGMTLIEIMISLLIGGVLIAGILQIFINTKQTYRLQDAQSRIQENGQLAMEFIGKDIRMAGFFGCASRNFGNISIENELRDASNFIWDISNPVEGFDNVDSTFTRINSVRPGTDVLFLRGLGLGIPLISPFSNSAQMFVTPAFNADCPASSAKTCHIGEILMVTDCAQGTIFQTTNTTDIAGGGGVNVVHFANATFTPGNATPAIFARSYGPGSEIARLQSFAYFIRDNPAGQPSLYRSGIQVVNNNDNQFIATELIEGIEDLQIRYGIDTHDPDRQVNYYVTADQANMAEVVSIRVSFVARSLEDGVTSRPLPYFFNGAQITPTDRRLRRVFTATYVLRNRLP